MNTEKFDRNNPEEYYHFDDAAKEVIIDRYDTPTPWMNYLSNGTFHTMMSQAGGAVAFYKSPQIWRLNRYRFFHLPTDRSGLYNYIRDAKTGEYWCPTAEPAFVKPESWQAAHGLGYSRFNAEHRGVKAELLYFISELENCIVWNLKLTNTSLITKSINLFSFVEFGMMEFLREISWVCYNKHQLKVEFNADLDALIYTYGVEMQPKPDETPLVYLAMNKKICGFDGDRDEFIGNYRSESNPYVIENGNCTNSTMFGGDPCGALQLDLELSPGATETINTFLGTGMTIGEIASSLAHCRQKDFVSKAKQSLKINWETFLGNYVCELPDKDAEREMNIWNPYQAQRNFQFSRNISYYATGTFRGVGYRDTSQDVLGMVSLNLDQSKEKLVELLSQQYQDGHTNHYYFKTEGWEPLNRLHSDNHIWPILAAWEIVMEAGDTDFLECIVPFYDGGEATVYEHLCRSVSFSEKNMGAYGFPLMLTSDWNDMLYKVCREGKGESIWMAMFLGYALPKLSELAELQGKTDDAKGFREFWLKLQGTVEEKAWDGKWYRRAIMDNGQYLGTAEMDEAKIFLNTQSWSVMSGMCSQERMLDAMDSVKELLDTPLGVKKLWPPIVNFPDPKDPLSHYNKGCGENGSIFCHANTWVIIAECMLGRGDRAWDYYRKLIPKIAMQNAGAWRYKAEPYAYVSNLFGPESDKFGLANVSWLTGTATWMHVAATKHILGIRPQWQGLLIDPCLPGDWDKLSVTRLFRGCTYHITIFKAAGVQKGVKMIKVDGLVQQDNLILHVAGRKKSTVEVFM
jgi:cellobiose phosphorylase